MNQQQSKRDKWLTIRVTEAEYEQVEKLTQRTTCLSMSEYARKTVLGKPVIMRYRNQSIEDFRIEMQQLLQDLNKIGSNFNQAVHRLQSLSFAADIQQWVLLNEQDKTQLFRQIDNIYIKINDIYQLWSRE
jgi:dimeric dUTPase (all-alpha-NTP-PPase superfamily)